MESGIFKFCEVEGFSNQLSQTCTSREAQQGLLIVFGPSTAPPGNNLR